MAVLVHTNGVQVAAAPNVATTAATPVTPNGYSTTAQANDIVAKLNVALTALRNHGLIAP